MSDNSLDSVYKFLSRKYVGKYNIHSIGIRRKSKRICIYISSDSTFNQKSILKHIEKEAAPYQILKIEEEKPILI